MSNVSAPSMLASLASTGPWSSNRNECVALKCTEVKEEEKNMDLLESSFILQAPI